MREDHSYDDIIHLPHPDSAVHPRMPLADRAAQFSPFAALTGHDAAIRETERLTQSRREPTEDQKELLDQRLQMIREILARQKGEPISPEINSSPKITFTYFEPDGKKEGGSYLTVTDRVRRIDPLARQVVLAGGTVLDIGRLWAIEGAMFTS